MPGKYRVHRHTAVKLDTASQELLSLAVTASWAKSEVGMLPPQTAAWLAFKNRQKRTARQSCPYHRMGLMMSHAEDTSTEFRVPSTLGGRCGIPMGPHRNPITDTDEWAPCR